MRRSNYIEYAAVDVFAAACAAQRINGEYVKSTTYLYDEDYRNIGVDKHANKDLVRQVLAGSTEFVQVTDADREQAEKVIQYCNSLTFKILSGATLNDYEQAMVAVGKSEMVGSNYEIGVISSLPSAYLRGVERKSVEARLRDTDGYLGVIGDRVELDIEVVRSVYSHNYGIYFVTGITDDNKAVFFSYNEKIEPGKMIHIKGRIKAHRDNNTQLNYVNVRS